MKTPIVARLAASLIAMLAGPVTMQINQSRFPAGDASRSESAVWKATGVGIGKSAADEPLIKLNDEGLRPITKGFLPSNRNLQITLATPLPMSIVAKGSVDGLTAKPKDVVIDIIVAYTKAAASYYADIRAELVDVAIAETNRSFLLSDITHVKLRLVYAYQTNYVEEGTHFDHVWRFADKGDGYMDEVHALRDSYHADVAVLIVDDSNGCGLATRVDADADGAFAVVHHTCAAANYTFAHEIGHLIGASHDLAYANGTKWRDIMSSKESCGGCPRLPVWSSPKVLISGEPAGNVKHDNARVIAEGAARVAAFR